MSINNVMNSETTQHPSLIDGCFPWASVLSPQDVVTLGAVRTGQGTGSDDAALRTLIQMLATLIEHGAVERPPARLTYGLMYRSRPMQVQTHHGEVTANGIVFHDGKMVLGQVVSHAHGKERIRVIPLYDAQGCALDAPLNWHVMVTESIGVEHDGA